MACRYCGREFSKSKVTCDGCAAPLDTVPRYADGLAYDPGALQILPGGVMYIRDWRNVVKIEVN